MPGLPAGGEGPLEPVLPPAGLASGPEPSVEGWVLPSGPEPVPSPAGALPSVPEPLQREVRRRRAGQLFVGFQWPFEWAGNHS